MTSTLAVIFDVDGVLVDSYHAHLRSWLEVAQADGVAFGENDFKSTFGQTSRSIIQRFWGEADPVKVREIDDRKEAIFRQIVAERFPAMPGATALISSLHRAGFVLAMGSSGPPENLELALDRLDVRELFSAVVSGRDIQRGKPAPDVFLKASERLGVPAYRCVVIEDAPVGIEAARAAGMKCVALVSTGRNASEFRRCAPDAVVESLIQLSPQRLSALLTQPTAVT